MSATTMGALVFWEFPMWMADSNGIAGTSSSDEGGFGNRLHRRICFSAMIFITTGVSIELWF